MNNLKDITLSILRNYYGQEYGSARVSRIARCVRLNLIYKSPDEFLTDRYRYYIRPLYLMGYISKEEMFERLKKQRELGDSNIFPVLRKGFEAYTMEEARRRKRYAVRQ